MQVPPRSATSRGRGYHLMRGDCMANRTTPSKPLSGAQRRHVRVSLGLPRYTEAEAARRKERDRERGRIRSAKNREMVSRLKLEMGCSRCGYREHPAALDFHHRDPRGKTATISKLASWERGDPEQSITAEIEKCVLLCANCHRIVTHTPAPSS